MLQQGPTEAASTTGGLPGEHGSQFENRLWVHEWIATEIQRLQHWAANRVVERVQEAAHIVRVGRDRCISWS